MAVEHPSLDAAKASIDRGDAAAALRIIAAIPGNDSDPQCIYLGGLCRAMSNDFQGAESAFARALAMGLRNEVVLGNLGLAKLCLGKPREAVSVLQQALQIAPTHPDSLRHIASAYDQLGEHEAAAQAAGKALQANGEDIAVINVLARSQMMLGRHAEAAGLLQRSLAIQSDQPQVWMQLPRALSMNKDYDQAESVYRQARRTYPADVRFAMLLGFFYESRNRIDDAMTVFESVLQNHPAHTRALAALARCHKANRHFDQADRVLEHALQQFPDDPDLKAERCSLMILRKQYEDAYPVSSSLLQWSQQSDRLDQMLTHSLVCRHTGRLDEAAGLLENILGAAACPPEPRQQALFQLGDIRDRQQRYDEAFDCYRQANSCIPLPDDIEYYLDVLEQLTTTVDRDYLDAVPASGSDSAKPVFIVGMPRSGTSLVEQIIAAHPYAWGAGELTDLWKIGNDISGAMNLLDYTRKLRQVTADEMATCAQRYLNALDAESGPGNSRVTDKLPHNFMHIGLIERLFPNARIIHCTRHPYDTCLSIYFRKFNDNHVYASSLASLGRFHAAYQRLMAHWHEVSGLAILDVDYRDLVEDQEATTRSIIDHIGLDWDDATLKYHESDRIIMTPSYHQASRPVYRDSLDRWLNYRAHLADLEASLPPPESC